MPRFVVLTHDHPFLHWDFMLQQGEALRTWRLLAAPDSGGKIMAEPLADHRTDYLDYEGPVGNNRGEVRRWDRGEYTTLAETANRISIRLQGEKLNGLGVLEAVDPGRNWLFNYDSAPSSRDINL